MSVPIKRDGALISLVAALLVIGMLMVQSASGPTALDWAGDSLYYVKRQAFGVVVGVAGACFIAWMPYRWLREGAWAFYAFCAVGLVLCFVPGISHSANGASRWIGMAGVHVQPSEFAKLALVVCLADFLSRRAGSLTDLKRVLVPALAIPLPLMILTLLEPDFGTTVLLAMTAGLVLFLAGLPLRWVAGLMAAGVAAGIPLVLLFSYRMKRIMSFIDPWADPAGTGYHVIQSMIAFSNGGLTGAGLGEGQAKHLFLPEPWTDFVGAVFAEEAGLIGVLVLLGLYAAVCWRGQEIARRAPDLFGTLVAGTLTALIGIQAALNLGVEMGVLPPKGLVLPFMSYGPSALMCHLFSIGALLNVAAASGRARRPTFSAAPLPEALGSA